MHITIDTNAVELQFRSLDLKKQDKAIRNAVSYALRPIRTDTMRRLRKVAKFSPETIRKGVRLSAYKRGEGGSVSIYHARGRNKEYMLRWYELGTEDRYTDKGAYRGKIKGRGYFADSRKMHEPKVLVRFKEKFNTLIIKLWKNSR